MAEKEIHVFEGTVVGPNDVLVLKAKDNGALAADMLKIITDSLPHLRGRILVLDGDIEMVKMENGAVSPSTPKKTEVLPHSRACGVKRHNHGAECHPNCPTCHGRADRMWLSNPSTAEGDIGVDD